MGLAFKENCPDLRNTRVIDIVNELQEYNCEVDVYDPWAEVKEAQDEYGITPIAQSALAPRTYDAIILAVGHSEFKAMGAKKIRALGKEVHILYDIKYLLDSTESDLRL
jgi:UDP-N-acetyl-D-galactosamine dehydrogenase